MAIPTDALVPAAELPRVQKLIANRLQYGKTFWKPLNVRQDYWALMYFLQDVIQQSKPLGQKRFISNMPRTSLDLAHSIMTRNDAFWRIPLFEGAGEGADMRRIIGRVERSLQGMIYDIDEMMLMRKGQRFWKAAAFQGLLNGMIAGKVHVTSEALEYRDSPLIGEIYDSRLVYPHFDGYGLDYVCIESVTTMGELVTNYPDKFEGVNQDDPSFDGNKRAFKLEYWSNSRPGRRGVNAVLAIETPAEFQGVIDLYTSMEVSSGTFRWIVEPYYHGYKPHALPVVVMPVNGVPVYRKPMLGDLLNNRLLERAELLGVPNAASWWQGENAWVAEFGRGLLSGIEEHFPQYNEIVATILHHFALNAYGQWISTTPDGQFPEFEPGIEARIALTPDEKIERVQVGAINADAYRLVAMLDMEQQNATISNILRAGGANPNTGVLFQQMANAALNTLEPFHDGLESFGTLIGTSLLAQLDAASGLIGKFDISAPRTATNRRGASLFVVEFDAKTDLEAFGGRRLRPVPVFKPSLPDDLAVRINAARFALDPRRPILSLVTVLENILQIEDPSEEIDRIWEDMANTDPVMVLEQIAQALQRLGEEDMAKRIRENEFRAQFVQDLAFRQATGNIPQGPQRPGALPPESGGGEFNARQTGMGGEPTATEGAEILGAMGERMSV